MVSKKKKQTIVDEALERFATASDSWTQTYKAALDDIAFVDEPDGQWDESVRQSRQNRPCLTFDKLSSSVDQVVGQQLQSLPGVKIRGAEEGDSDVAEIYEGLIRQIEQRGNKAYKTAFKFAVKGGWAVWMIDHDYIDDISMNQDIVLREIKNPFSVLFDPIIQVQPLKEARYAFMFDDMEVDEFEKLYPKAQSTLSDDFSSTGNTRSWVTEETIRVADYFRIVSKDVRLCQLSTGEVVDYAEIEPIMDELNFKGVTITNERLVEGRQLERFKMTGLEILDQYECVGRYIPLVPLLGKTSNIDGRFVTRGIVRKAKDAQRMYNYSRSTSIEVTALQPKQPLMATPAMIKGHEDRYRNLMTSNDPVLLFNFDQGQKPFREPPGQPSGALITDVQISSDDIKSTTGIFDASLGAKSNETSGRAIRERQLQGNIATYEFVDELVESMKFTGEIMVDLIPKIYDAERQIRILGADDAEEVMTINKPQLDLQTGEHIIINDLNRGHYDVKVTTGPSFSTRRSETAEQLGTLFGQNPSMAQLGADIYFKSLDLVGADELVERVRKQGIKQGLIEPNDDEKEQQTQAQAQEKQIKMQAVQLEMAMKQAKLAGEQADAQETQSKTLLNNVKAQVEQLELAQGQQDMEAQKIAALRLKQTIANPYGGGM
tara:strand:+ start:256 stop:2235 length:1980 start_codon:yes stop_codon:yes gene_type:complete